MKAIDRIDKIVNNIFKDENLIGILVIAPFAIMIVSGALAAYAHKGLVVTDVGPEQQK